MRENKEKINKDLENSNEKIAKLLCQNQCKIIELDTINMNIDALKKDFEKVNSQNESLKEQIIQLKQNIHNNTEKYETVNLEIKEKFTNLFEN